MNEQPGPGQEKAKQLPLPVQLYTERVFLDMEGRRVLVCVPIDPIQVAGELPPGVKLVGEITTVDESGYQQDAHFDLKAKTLAGGFEGGDRACQKFLAAHTKRIIVPGPGSIKQ